MASTHTAGGTGLGDSTRQSFNTKLPVTALGKWSMWIAVAFIVMFAINAVFVGALGTSTDPGWQAFSSTYLPFYGIGMLAVGLAAGVVGLVAILKQKERSLITLLTILPALFVVVFLLGEFLVPH